MAITKVTSGLISADASSIDLNIDAGTLYLDVSENRVGIGTTSPSKELDVVGTIKATGADNANTMEVFGSTTTNQSFGLLVDAGTSAADYAARFRKSDNNVIMEVSGSGNVGIGTTSPVLDLQIGSATSGVDANMFLAAGSNAYSRLYMGDATTGTGLYAGLLMYDHGNDAMTMFTSSTERMRISSNGSIGVGTTDSTYSMSIQNIVSNDVMLQIKNTTANEDTGIFIDAVQGGAATNSRIGHSVIAGNNLLQISNPNGHAFYTGTSSITERMRIDSSGKLLVDTTSIGNASTNAKVCASSEFLSRGTAAGYFWENRSGMTIAAQSGWGGWYSTGTASHFLYSDGANRASIGRTSGTYTALSDVNKKKDFEDSTVGLAEVMQLQPKKFRMLEDADDAPKKLGFIAQDVENVIPEAYVEDTNEDASGVENTFIGLTDRPIIAALTKAIQEQQTIIEDLKTRIETLENA